MMEIFARNIIYVLIISLKLKELSAGTTWCDMMVKDEGWFRCTDRQSPYCVSHYYRCDHTQHCQDNSDELGCPGEAPEASPRDMSSYCVGCTDMEHQVLDHHNMLRGQEPAANINQLQWSDSAFEKAHQQAKLCRLPSWGESPHGNMEPDFSQNVARIYTSYSLPTSVVLKMIDAWYEEKEMYDYESDSCTGQCGHYKVMVTAYSRHLGCALVQCTRHREQDSQATEFWNFVCNYSPGYNWMVWTSHPDQPYIKGEGCDQCQPNLQCHDQLCA